MGERMSYKVEDQGDGLVIRGDGHTLFISKNPAAVHRARFDIAVTARSFDVYPRDAHPTDPSQVVVEVGAGLGGFIPTLAQSHRGHLIVIDPFDYTVAQEMLKFAKGLELADWQRSHVEDLLERSGVYLDSNRVQLVPYRLSEVLEVKPSLIGSADIVVDYYGSLHYSRAERLGELRITESAVINLERRLLKPSGILVAKRMGGFPQVIRP